MLHFISSHWKYFLLLLLSFNLPQLEVCVTVLQWYVAVLRAVLFLLCAILEDPKKFFSSVWGSEERKGGRRISLQSRLIESSILFGGNSGYLQGRPENINETKQAIVHIRYSVFPFVFLLLDFRCIFSGLHCMLGMCCRFSTQKKGKVLKTSSGKRGKKHAGGPLPSPPFLAILNTVFFFFLHAPLLSLSLTPLQ